MPTPYQYPALWRRLAAIIYDSLLVIAISIIYGVIVLLICKFVFGIDREHVNKLFFQLGWLSVIVGFFCFFWHKAGQTLGMRTWRLKIIQQDTQQYPSLVQGIARCFLAPVGLLLFISAFLHPNRQCLHDQITKTQTILVDKNT